MRSHRVSCLRLSRPQSATMAGAPTDQARVFLAVPRPASATLLDDVRQSSRDGRRVAAWLSAMTSSSRTFGWEVIGVW